LPPDPARPLVALEISPLGERHHTGIANVTKGLAIELVSDETVDGRFFFNRSEIPRSIVERLMETERGDILWWLASRADLSTRVPFPVRGAAVGIYANHKWHRRLFPIEVQIVHDLTTIVAPQFHTAVTIDSGERQLLGDMYSSDLIVAVSESTKADIQTYFPSFTTSPASSPPSRQAQAKPRPSMTEPLPSRRCSFSGPSNHARMSTLCSTC
jgi:hypothetical protein